MEDSIEHRLSALLDGETSEFETRRLIEEINRRPEIKNLWIRMNKTKSLLAAEIDFSPRNISSTVIEELDSSSIKQIKFSKDEKSKQLKYYGFAFGVLLSLGLVFQPLMIQEKKSFKSTSVIPALSIGNTPVSSNESYLEEIGNNLKGSLKKIEFIEDGDIIANYVENDSNRSFKLRVLFRDLSIEDRIKLSSTGITVHSLANNKPVVINLSSEEINNELSEDARWHRATRKKVNQFKFGDVFFGTSDQDKDTLKKEDKNSSEKKSIKSANVSSTSQNEI